jgi:hypothetical protein
LPRFPPELDVEADFYDQEVAVRLPRMTTRRLMLAVATLAVLMGAGLILLTTPNRLRSAVAIVAVSMGVGLSWVNGRRR